MVLLSPQQVYYPSPSEGGALHLSTVLLHFREGIATYAAGPSTRGPCLAVAWCKEGDWAETEPVTCFRGGLAMDSARACRAPCAVHL